MSYSLTRISKSGGRAAVDEEAGRRTRSRVSQADLVEENNLGEDELCLIRISTCKSCWVDPSTGETRKRDGWSLSRFCDRSEWPRKSSDKTRGVGIMDQQGTYAMKSCPV